MPKTNDWTLGSSLSSLKFVDGFLSYGYKLAWTVQVDTTKTILPFAYVTTWFSPKWVKGSNDYANYVCQKKWGGTPLTSTDDRIAIRKTSKQYI